MKQRGFLNREEAMQEASNAYHGADSILSVHRASSLPGNIHAQAFTRFPEIHMASTAESCFTHELGHAVQQMMSPITANKHIKGNAIQDHAFLEKEADIIGERLKQIPIRQQGIVHTSKGNVMQPAYYTNEQLLLLDKTFMKKARAFEKRLGIYLYTNASVIAEAKIALKTLIETLVEFYNSYDALFQDKKSSSGQIGPQIDAKATACEVLDNGNLREIMTMFYNGAFSSRNKDTLAKSIADEKRRAGQPDYMLDNLYQVAGGDAQKMFDLDKLLPILNATKGAAYNQKLDEQRTNRTRRSAVAHVLTEELLDDKLSLSGRERAYLAAFLPQAPLPWISGKQAFKLQGDSTKGKKGGTDNSADWFIRTHLEKRIPTTSGTSGTTIRMLAAYKMLGLHNEEGFLCALLAWMICGEDHSLYEILKGAKYAGMPMQPLHNIQDLYGKLPEILHIPDTQLRALDSEFYDLFDQVCSMDTQTIPASTAKQCAWILEENGDRSYRLEDLKLTWYQNKQQPDELYYITDDASSPYAPLSGKNNAATWITWYQRKPDSSLLRSEIVEHWDLNTRETLLFYIEKRLKHDYHSELDTARRMERAATLIAIGLQWNTAFSLKQIQDKVLPILSADPIFQGIDIQEIKTVFELSRDIKGSPEMYMTQMYKKINPALKLMLKTQGDEVDTDESALELANLLALNWNMNLLTPYEGRQVGRGEGVENFQTKYPNLYRLTQGTAGTYDANETVIMNKTVSTFYDNRSTYAKKSLQWIIQLTGKHGAYLPKSEQKYGEEYEVMLPPGTRLQVDKIHYTTDKITLYAHTLDYQGVSLKYKTKAI